MSASAIVAVKSDVAPFDRFAYNVAYAEAVVQIYEELNFPAPNLDDKVSRIQAKMADLRQKKMEQEIEQEIERIEHAYRYKQYHHKTANMQDYNLQKALEFGILDHLDEEKHSEAPRPTVRIATLRAPKKVHFNSEAKQQKAIAEMQHQKEALYDDQVSTPGYGRLDIHSVPNTGYWASWPDAKKALEVQQAKYEFSSKKVYFIHCFVELAYQSPMLNMKAYFVDNYGFCHMVQGHSPFFVHVGELYPDKTVKIDVSQSRGDEGYIYPLPNQLIDTIKAMPMIVGNPHAPDTNYPQLESIINILPSIRKNARFFY
jgi:hypothetical protein